MITKLMQLISGKTPDVSMMLKEDAIKHVKALNKKHDLKFDLKINLNCIAMSDAEKKNPKIRQNFYNTYFAPIDLALTTFAGSLEDSRNLLEQFTHLEILPNEGTQIDLLFNDSTFRFRRNFTTKNSLTDANIEILATKIYEVLKEGMISYS